MMMSSILVSTQKMILRVRWRMKKGTGSEVESVYLHFMGTVRNILMTLKKMLLTMIGKAYYRKIGLPTSRKCSVTMTL